MLVELLWSERVTASHLTGIERLVTLASGGPVMLTCPVSMGHLTSFNDVYCLKCNENRVGSQSNQEKSLVGTKKTGKGRRKIGRKKRRMRAKIRHRKK
jgi:hypothetical protein